MTDEQWAAIPDFPDYEVSTLGRVRSLDRFVDYIDGRRAQVRGRILRPAARRQDDYRYVQLYMKKVSHTRLVQHLVLEAFVGPRPPGHEACHGPGGPGDNRLANLRWDTPSENALDVVRSGNHHMAKREQCPSSHLLVSPNLIPSQLRRGVRGCLACDRAHGLVRNRRRRSGIEVPFKPLADAYYAEIMAGREPPRDRRRRSFAITPGAAT